MSKSIKAERTEYEGYSKTSRQTIAKAINVRRNARKAKRMSYAASESWEQQQTKED